MRTAICNAIFWLVEPFLDRLDERKQRQKMAQAQASQKLPLE